MSARAEGLWVVADFMRPLNGVCNVDGQLLPYETTGLVCLAQSGRIQRCYLYKIELQSVSTEMNKRLLTLSLGTIALLGVFLAPSLVGAFHTGPRTWHVKAGWDLQTFQGAISAQVFSPRTLCINVGDTVVWTSHHSVGEPHTASFDFGNEPHPDLVGPVAVGDNSFSPVPSELFEPVVVGELPSGQTLILAENARVYLPVDEWGEWVNSGVIWPEAAVEETGLGAVSWSYTFTEPGTYDYHCVFHHWMTGTIVVRG